MTEPVNWAKVKRRQAHEADRVAAIASGIGEYGIANACYRLVGILRRQAENEEARARGGVDLPDLGGDSQG